MSTRPGVSYRGTGCAVISTGWTMHWYCDAEKFRPKRRTCLRSVEIRARSRRWIRPVEALRGSRIARCASECARTLKYDMPSLGHRRSHHRMSRLLSHRDGVLPAFSFRRRIGTDDGSMECLPILGRELPQLLHREVLQEFVRVNVLSDRLDLQKGNVASEFNRDVGFEDPDIVEQGAKPIIGLDDAFQHVIRKALREIGHPANQQAPSRRGLGDSACPDLQPAGLNGRRQEWRRKTAHPGRGGLVEYLAESRILHGIARQRQPLVHAIVGPQHVVPVPDHLECHGKEDIPAEGGRAGEGFAISQGARRDDAADRLVGAARRGPIGHHLKEFDERAAKRLISNHSPMPSGAMRRQTNPVCPRERDALPRANDDRNVYRTKTGAKSPSRTLPWSRVAASRITLSPARMGRTKTGAQSPSRTLPWSRVAASRTTLSPARMGRRAESFIVSLPWMESR